MHMKRLASAACALVLCVLVCLGTVGCKSDKDKVVDLVTHTMESYSVAADDQADAKSNKDAVEPTYGDDATMTQLTAYGVRDFEYHEHCFKNYSFEVGDATVDGNSASVSVTVTNQSLSAAADAAASDYKAWAETEESQQAYAESGRQALVDKLVELLYARLDANESPVTTTVAVSLSKDGDGNWSVDGTPEFFSALYGGSDVINLPVRALVQVGKPRVRLAHALVHGDVGTLALVEKLLVDGGAAEEPDLLVSVRGLKRPLRRGEDLDPLRGVPLLMRDHHVAAALERPSREALEGLSAHEHGTASGELHEAAHVGAVGHEEPTVLADGPVRRD